MRKFLLISCVSLLILSLFAVGISAEPLSRTDSDFENFRSISDDYSYRYLVFPYSPYSALSPSVTFDVLGSYYLNGVLHRFSYVSFGLNGSVLYVSDNVSDEDTLINSSGTLDSNWDGYLYFDEPTILPSSVVNWYNSQNSTSASVGSGVLSSISFGGQVLNFITSSEGILALLGLAVGLCLFVPFSIRKIKDFVKGY